MLSTIGEDAIVQLDLIPPRRRRLLPPAAAVALWLGLLVVVIELAKASA